MKPRTSALIRERILGGSPATSVAAHTLVFCGLAVLLWLPFAALAADGAEDEEQGKGRGFESFRIVAERNIFSPNRRPRRQAPTSDPRPEPAADHLDHACSGIEHHEHDRSAHGAPLRAATGTRSSSGASLHRRSRS